MEFRLLGPFEVVEHERLLQLGGRKQRSLLAVLLLHANEVVSTDRLIDELWAQKPPRTAAKSIQLYVSGLRKELGEGRIVTRLYGFERAGQDLRVAAEIYPVSAPQDSQPQWRFYDFLARDQAHHFAEETLLALEYLGCIVTERPAARSTPSATARAQVA